jgi:hypothetical protein
METIVIPLALLAGGLVPIQAGAKPLIHMPPQKRYDRGKREISK